MNDHEEVYKNYWRHIIEDEHGVIDKDQLAKELYDALNVYKRAEALMEMVTNGQSNDVFCDSNEIMLHFYNMVQTIKRTYKEEIMFELATDLLKDPVSEEDIIYDKLLKDVIKYLEDKNEEE